MTINKVDGKYKLDIRPNGSKGKRIIRLFDTKAQAVQFRNKTLSQKQTDYVLVDNRQLNELIEIWFNLHGRGLRSAVDRKNRLFKLSQHIGNPIARLLTPEIFTNYRNIRLDANISPTTLNHELSFLKALYNELKRLAIIDYDSPFLQLKKLRTVKTELAYLTPEQIKILILQVQASTNESLPYIVNICLPTGARWSEAQNLTASNCIAKAQ